jgi:hypothetical protein
MLRSDAHETDTGLAAILERHRPPRRRHGQRGRLEYGRMLAVGRQTDLRRTEQGRPDLGQRAVRRRTTSIVASVVTAAPGWAPAPLTSTLTLGSRPCSILLHSRGAIVCVS